jgi:Lipase
MCSHFHAVRYWVETLNPNSRRSFSATKCSNWNNFVGKKCEKNARNLMGLDANPQMQGNFFLKVQTNRFFDGIEFFNYLLKRMQKRLVNLITFDI